MTNPHPNSRAYTPMSDADRKKVLELYNSGRSMTWITKNMPEVRAFQIRKLIYPEAAALHLEQRRSKRISREDMSTIRIDRSSREDAARLMKQIPPDTRDLTARLCGDPLPTRSALDTRGSRE